RGDGTWKQVPSSAQEPDLSGMERLRKAARRVAFHAPDAHDAAKKIGREPSLAGLRRETLEQSVHLSLHDSRRQGHEGVRTAKVSVVLGNFIFEDRMVAERVPGKLA